MDHKRSNQSAMHWPGFAYLLIRTLFFRDAGQLPFGYRPGPITDLKHCFVS